MTRIVKVYKGDSSDVLTVRPTVDDLPDELDGNWVCKTCAIDADGAVAIAVTTVTTKTTDADGKEWFQVVLTPDLTNSANIANGKRFRELTWVTQVENATLTPAYAHEVHIPLRVYVAGIS